MVNYAHRRRSGKMTDTELRAVVQAEVRSANGYVGGETSEDRRRAMEYYHTEPFGNEQEGRSQVVSSDVQDTIETLMPDLMEIFAAGDEVVRFEPANPEDAEIAKQATDYINHIWRKDNDGFTVTHDWLKDALLQKNGVVKIWWDETPVTRRHSFTGLNILQVQELLDDEDVEVIEQTERPAEEQELPFAPDGLVYDLTVVRTVEKGRVNVVTLPPEEFLISRRAVSLDDAPFTAHKVEKTVSELLQEGYSQEELDEIPSHDEQDYNEERVARFNNDDEWPDDSGHPDPAMREIWLFECYIRMDYDGDGIAEMRQITAAGPQLKVLRNEEVDDHPFCALSPIRIPHKFFGRSLADLTMDLQFLKSTLWRQTMDNIYFANNQRQAVNERVNLDDLLVNRPSAPVRVEGDTPIGDAIRPLDTQPIIQHIMPLLEYTDQVRETRTGITRYAQGLDPDALNSTATGTNLLLGRTQMRMLMIARLFAETGFRDAFKKILRLVIENQDRPRVIRLRNEWVPMDPRSWNADMDVKVTVGLGHGTRESEMAGAQMLLQAQQQVVEYQGGANGPLVTLENLYNTFATLTKATGFSDVDKYFTDPQGQQQQPQQQQPDPEIVKAQLEAQVDREKMQTQAQIDREKMVLEHMRKMEEMGAEITLERLKAMMETAREAVKLDMEREQADAENVIAMRGQDIDARTKRDTARNQVGANS